ncbi:Aspartic proteinase [Arachis hypogaea]|uniref:Aspartic proteinase n=1 Tax=Arachis hypogaea TaxID=3818 RepID=A0A6B9VDC9_ARAHY|nr:Aspartic proteinase [Arachis hypogaea]
MSINVLPRTNATIRLSMLTKGLLWCVSSRSHYLAVHQWLSGTPKDRCGYNQKYFGLNSLPSTARVLGLGRGIASFLSQLHALGLVRDVVGHCLSVQGGGFLFFGDDLIPSSVVVWIPMFPGSLDRNRNGVEKRENYTQIYPGSAAKCSAAYIQSPSQT